MTKKFKLNKPLTKRQFEQLLKISAQPVSEQKHDQEESETSAGHPSDGYTETHKRQDKTEDAEDLQSD